MSTVSTQHYGVTMSIDVSSFPGCCGGTIIYGFNVRGSTSNLTRKQKEAMYDELFIRAAKQYNSSTGFPGVVVAMDCVLSFGDWEDLGRGGGTVSTSWTVDAGCGDISLEDFCLYHQFEITSHSINRNSGNVVAAMTKAIRPALEDGGEGDIYSPKKPSFSDEPKPEPKKPSADVKDIIESLRSAVAAAREQNS